MKFVLIISGIILFVLVVVGGGWYAYRSQVQNQGTAPVLLQNPFSTKPNKSFGEATTPVVVNPFASPTPTTYQNPFSSQSSSSPSYQNPFEKLR